MSCPIRYVCGGGCRELSLNEHNDVSQPVKVACKLVDIFFRTAVWIMSEVDIETLAKIIPEPKKLQVKERK